ncbi:MAG: LacI family transcriptional regulator [Chlorobi bacterium]|nr:LacI family transcriptional regulator [Chlorobiota bacterium]
MSKKKTQITLQDIADKLNVTKVTVSKALRNHPDISDSTAKLIKKTADKMGYIPNFAARNLSAKKTSTIGVIVPVIANSFFAQIIDSIYNCAFDSDYDIILAVSQEDSEKEKKHLETMLAMRVDGIIISVCEKSENHNTFLKIKSLGVPIVFFDRTIEDDNFSSVTINNVQGAYKAVVKAIESGYKSIGHIGGWQNINIGRDRYAGYKEALRKHKIHLNKKHVIFGGFGEDDGYKAFMELYSKQNLPDILFTVTFPVALGVYNAAKEVGLKIPKDIDVITFGQSSINRFLKPKLSYVDLQTNDIGPKTFELILEHIRSGKKFAPKKIEIDTDLVMNETCIKKI